MNRLAALALLTAAWLGLTAATPLPLAPAPPDLTGLVPFVSAPLDKPTLSLPIVPLPPAPLDVPHVPPAIVVLPTGERPSGPMQPPRTLPCVGAWTGSASEALECGRARYRRGDFEDAARALEDAVRGGGELGTEARYWLGEALYRLGRIEWADTQFQQAGQGRSVTYVPFARHAGGWTSFMLSQPARARDAFAQVLGVQHPAVLDPWARYGLGLSQYALGRFADAERTFADLLTRRPPPALERSALFWHGDALGRIGEPEKAAEELARFTQGGAHPLLNPALVRLGWWSLMAKRPMESAAAFRGYAGTRQPEAKPEDAKAGPARTVVTQEVVDRDWADAGLALALLATDDWDGARAAAQPLTNRRSPLALLVQLRLAEEALKRRAFPAVDAAIADAMRGTLTPQVRAWLLALRGDTARLDGKGDDARTQYDLARGIDAGSETGRYAIFRLAQVNLEMREANQALTDLEPLLNRPGDPGMRLAVLLLEGEAAYRAGNYRTASTAFERVLVDAPEYPDKRAVYLALAWTALRERQLEDAGRRFLQFADLYPDDEQTPSALVLASEMALASGNLQAGRELLDRVIARHPRVPRTEFARLNRAILMLRTGAAASAVPLLRDWISRVPFLPLLGRAEAALGIALLTSGRPDEARKEFMVARREGEGALASLGLATVALAEDKPAEAIRDFQEAQTDGTRTIAATADYGLAVAAFQRGDVASFRKTALAVIDAAPRGPLTPRLLYALAGASAEAKEWTPALSTAKRLADEFSDDERADDALERVGGAAARERIWPVVYDAYTLLRQKYPRSPFVDDSRLAYGEAQLETGRGNEARKTLEQYVATTSSGPNAIRSRFLLIRACEMSGDRACAVDAYKRAASVVPAAEWDRDMFFRYVRLLRDERLFDDAKRLLEPFVKTAPADLAVEGTFALGEVHQAQGDRAAALEYYMSAAYIAPDSVVGHRALLSAGRLLATMRQPEAAATVYLKLLAQPDVSADLQSAARRGLAEIGR